MRLSQRQSDEFFDAAVWLSHVKRSINDTGAMTRGTQGLTICEHPDQS